jgi:regulator of replication initiation timing
MSGIMARLRAENMRLRAENEKLRAELAKRDEHDRRKRREVDAPGKTNPEPIDRFC